MELRKSFDTIRYLRGRQIVGQLMQRLRSLRGDQVISRSRNIPEFPGSYLPLSDSILPPGGQRNSAGDLLSGTFTFLNSTHSLGWPPDWEPEGLAKLGKYNLHYFEWLWALDYTEAKQAVSDWIEQYDLRRLRVGWEPYPVSLRLMNWSILFFGKFRDRTESDREFLNILWRSIFIQSQWLLRNLEVHLLGNHFFENGAALALVGSCFKGPAADRWYQMGKKIVTAEINEQVLSDGMHFERSPMYHLRYIYLLLLLMKMGRDDIRPTARAAAGEMISALRCLRHPDGEIALFNDSALGIYNRPADLIALWENETGSLIGEEDTAPAGNWALPEAGYYGFRDDDGNYLICDAGPVGPDYLPGHAHGDIFSFELSLKGHRVIVDSGVYEYAEGLMRDYCRSTGAHNTVEIAGQDQCEFWGAFRVARRGYPHDIVWQPSGEGFVLSGWHDGYRRLSGAPTHYRQFIRSKDVFLKIQDRVESHSPVKIVSRVHLHPDCLIKSHKGNQIDISYPGGQFRITFFGEGDLKFESSIYCPEFGRRLDNKAISFISSGSKIETGYFITPL